MTLAMGWADARGTVHLASDRLISAEPPWLESKQFSAHGVRWAFAGLACVRALLPTLPVPRCDSFDRWWPQHAYPALKAIWPSEEDYPTLLAVHGGTVYTTYEHGGVRRGSGIIGSGAQYAWGWLAHRAEMWDRAMLPWLFRDVSLLDVAVSSEYDHWCEEV